MSSPRDLIGQVSDLPSLPAIYFRVKSIIERPDSSLIDVEREISCDAALTGRLLCLANSMFYSVRGKVDSVLQALSILGTEQIKYLLLVTSVATAFRGVSPALMDMKKFWLMSAYRALVARSLANQCGRFDGERSFVEGLLGDVGHLVMYLGMPRAAENALQRSLENRRPLHRVECDLLGFDYAEVGAELLATWNLSPIIEAAVRHHPQPSAAGDLAGEASILHVATLSADAAFRFVPIESWAPRVEPFIWREAGLSAECLPALEMEAGQELEALVQGILPDFDLTAWREKNS